MFNNILMYNSINFFCCYSCLDCSMTNIECISCKLRSLSQKINILGLKNRDNFVSDLLFLHIGLSSVGIIRFLNVIRDFPSCSETIRERSYGSGVFKAIILYFFFFLVEKLVEIPETFKAFLITEIAWI